ncbi:protein cycle-like isoform X2 [Liolophura sinensis]|uniref:protein cycle-like isoform X2 n=1 Tax=Liolophura sinensis TaxID=3198878 RepID=UPI00315808A4
MPGSVTELSDNADKQNRTQEKQSGKRRLSRNESEKLRRDKLNMHIAELAKLVPIVASAPRKVDKSSVLRLAVNYLRLHKDLKKMKEFDLWRPGFLTQENLSAALLEAYDGFLLVISQKGIILYVSDLITTLLGHSQMDLLGQSVYSFVHPDDVPLCKEQFQIRPKPRQVNGKTETSSYNNNHDKPNTLSSVYCSPNKGRRSFYVRMLNLTNRDHKVYDLVHLTCHVRTFLQPEHTGLMGSHSVVIGVGRLAAQQPIKDLSLIPTNMQEFITQHTLDGKIIYTDHRQSVCMGRLPREIHGTSPYDYIYHEDLVAIHYSHQKVIREGNIPSTVFRSYTKSGSLVCIQATSSICCDNWTKQPKFILSNNVIISEDDFSVLMLKQREDLNRILNACKQSDSAITESPQESDQEGPVSAKRQRLEPSPDSQRDSEVSANSRGEQNLSEETSPLSCMSNSLVDSPHVSPLSNQDPASELTMELTPDVSEASINTRRNDSTNNSNIDSSFTDLQSQGLDSRTGSSKNGSILANLLYGLDSPQEKAVSLPLPVVSSDAGNQPLSANTDVSITSGQLATGSIFDLFEHFQKVQIPQVVRPQCLQDPVFQFLKHPT